MIQALLRRKLHFLQLLGNLILQLVILNGNDMDAN